MQVITGRTTLIFYGGILLTQSKRSDKMNEKVKNELEKHLSNFSKDIERAASCAISNALTDCLPHILSDTEFNIEYRSQDAIRNLIAGNFEREGNYLNIMCGTGDLRVRLEVSSYEYDNIRKSLIEVMPECPKDLEIQSLKEQLKNAYERIY